MSRDQDNLQAVPMQNIESRMNFCDRYFAAVSAAKVYEADEYREYELPLEVDKELTDRPYYWMWVEQTGQMVRPTVLRLAFSEHAEERENHRIRDEALSQAEPYLNEMQKRYFVAPKSELVTLGSFRLDRLYDSCLRRGRFASIAPRTHVQNPSLVPWIMFNTLISYRCDTTEQTLLSIGVCLENGQVVDKFYNMITHLDMATMSPGNVEKRMKHSISSGFQTFCKYVTRYLTETEHDWAVKANDRLRREIDQIHTYYQSLEHDVSETDLRVIQAERDRKIQQATLRGAPRIVVDMKQVALVGLIDKSDLRGS